MKKILVWATDYRKQHFSEYGDLDITYANSFEEFEANLCPDCIPALSVTFAVESFEKVDMLLNSRKDIRFYFLEQDAWEIIRDSEIETRIPDYFERQSKDWDLRDWTRGNVEVSKQSAETIVEAARM